MGLSFLAGSAHAASFVTLYGIADTGVVYTSKQGSHTNYQLASGNVQGSRWEERPRLTFTRSWIPI
ncbi:porin [Paraburkholderia tropica]|uniref:porin n=1 Tax=Paraburkholderia tropica TaxID=92647 RepID=UPI0031E05E3F